jgi:hypothetical protein
MTPTYAVADRLPRGIPYPTVCILDATSRMIAFGTDGQALIELVRLAAIGANAERDRRTHEEWLRQKQDATERMLAATRELIAAVPVAEETGGQSWRDRQPML